MLSTAFHPQTDGQSERANQEIETYLRIYCSHQPDKWLAYLPIIEFVHNSTPRQGKDHAPFYYMMGYDPKDLPSSLPHAHHKTVLDRLRGIQRARKDAIAAHRLTAYHMEQRVTTRSYRTYGIQFPLHYSITRACNHISYCI